MIPAKSTSSSQAPQQAVVPWLNQVLALYPASISASTNVAMTGLNSEFAIATYVETALDTILWQDIQTGLISLVVLFGDTGDGKTALLQHLAHKLGVDLKSSQQEWEVLLTNGKKLHVNMGDATRDIAAATQLLDEILVPFHKSDHARDHIQIVAVDSSSLLGWVESQPNTRLTDQLRQALLGQMTRVDKAFRLINLNQRCIVGNVQLQANAITSQFLNQLISALLGMTATWQPCENCTAAERCTAWHSVRTLQNPKRSPLVRQRLIMALQACHHRGTMHITMRELRATLSYILFGIHDCHALHTDPTLRPPHYWHRVFAAESPQRCGKLLAELLYFDPALESDPVGDRMLLQAYLQATPQEERRVAPKLALAAARRRGYFIYSQGDISLNYGSCLEQLQRLPLLDSNTKKAFLRELCLGIAKLEPLPLAAFSAHMLSQGVPIYVIPRTPTETILWVLRPWQYFTLEAIMPAAVSGLEILHTHLRLVYSHSSERKEQLLIGLELLQLLQNLAAGIKTLGTIQEGLIANLRIFAQCLAQEDTSVLYAWHPLEQTKVYKIYVDWRGKHRILVRERQDI